MHIVTLEALMADPRRVLHRVQAGDHLTITQEDRPIVFITPANPEDAKLPGHRMVANGQSKWNGERPKMPKEVIPSHGVDLVAMIVEDRR